MAATRLSSTNEDLQRARRYRLDLLRSVCADSFRAFMEHAWSVIDPTRALLPSVAIDGMCAAGQAVADGRIKRLAVSTCPGTSKSIVWGIGFPAWLLLRSRGRARIMAGSYSWDFATRDSRRCRDLVTSSWFEDLVGGTWDLRPDANRDDDWWTTGGGRRMIVSVGGKALGERCTFQLVDDALSGADIHSAAAKKEATRWINEVLPSRLEDPDRDPRIIIGQRLAVDDPIAETVRQGWKYLALPAVLDGEDEPCELYDDAGEIVWRDDRKPGDPIVSLLGHEALARLRLELGSMAFTAQYLQKPLPAGGSMFKRAWFDGKIVDAAPSGGRQVRGWDLAATAGKDATAATAGVKLRLVGGKIYVEHCRWLQGSAHDVEIAIAECAASDGHACAIDIPQDPGQAGKAQKSYLASKLGGYTVHFSPETGSKETRAQPFAAQCEAGNVYLVRGPWMDAWLDEIEGFPAARLKDRVDASSRAYAAIVRSGRANVDVDHVLGGAIE